MQTETVPKQTAADIIKEARKADPEQRMYVLYQSGVGSKVVAAAPSYVEMWQHAERETGETKKDILKKSYSFDVMSAREAAKLVG